MLYSSSSGDDRRQHKRFLVNGVASIDRGYGHVIQGELLNVGAGGLLVLTPAALAKGTPVHARFIVKDYPLEISVQGTVAHSTETSVGVMFSEEPEGLDEILLWLEAGFLAAMLA